MFANRPRPIRKIVDTYYIVKALKAEIQYEQMIAESQAKLAETTLVPGYTNIYC